MATYKTPGVYVEEISKLPPSVAQVETAIPAFIGYTEKAMELSPADLLRKPKRIGAMVDFEFFYGYGPSPNVSEVNIDNSNNFLSAKVSSNFYLYDSVRMFFANGGGDCYIVSVGDYASTPSNTDFTNGLSDVEKVDEPTILLFPDAVTLSDDNFAAVQQAALAQCNFLQDRVALLDTKRLDPKGVTFKNKIGINFLSYGTVYTPWLKVTLPKAVKFTDINGAGIIKRSGIVTPVSGLTSDPDLQTKITELGQIYADVTKVKTQTTALGLGSTDLWNNFNALEAAFNTTPSAATLNDIFEYVYSVALKIETYTTGAASFTFPAFKTDVTNAVTSNFIPVFTEVKELERELDDDPDAAVAYTAANIAALPSPLWDPVKNAVAATLIPDALTPAEKFITTLNLLKPMFDEVNRAYISLISDTASNYAKTLDTSLALSFPIYKNLLAGVSNSMTSMPPSGAIAGVYAMVDRTRGVWKAPANVSLSNVLEPEVIFTRSELDALNVDAVAGKSINAIRFFFGKGTLVFGARTLAGNDNEWRYISVRRFFNMVEESSKKSTEGFVFEPNDSNTWVKVQGMIENFLVTLWREGALQGAKPEHAFYVAVGLGKTMTPLDILEGRMIVEIGMAVVRPAEFIILRFSHKMAES
ncbi:MAG: phage tail sheath C-terminal domain-containing protein [Ginsengibacter sp.]